jgi:hypothetical protein
MHISLQEIADPKVDTNVKRQLNISIDKKSQRAANSLALICFPT